jgi:hypothetical protein
MRLDQVAQMIDVRVPSLSVIPGEMSKVPLALLELLCRIRGRLYIARFHDSRLVLLVDLDNPPLRMLIARNDAREHSQSHYSREDNMSAQKHITSWCFERKQKMNVFQKECGGRSLDYWESDRGGRLQERI